LNINRASEGGDPMVWQRFFQWGVVGTRAARPQHGVRGRDLGATRRRRRPGVEALEGRQLLAALAEFPLNSNQTAVVRLTAGPDGNLWFPLQQQEGGARIVRLTTAGGLTDFPLPSGYSQPETLTVGPDGNLWFINQSDTYHGPAVAQITPSGVITEFPISTTITSPPSGGMTFSYPMYSNYATTSDLIVGPDGNLWCTESSPSSSGAPAASAVQITPAGVITQFTLPITDNVVSGLAVGSDGNLWYSSSTSTNFDASSAIDQITTKGVVTEFGLPGTYFNASALTTGPDGNLWFSNQTTSPPSASIGSVAIGRITPTGGFTEYALSPKVSSTSTLTAGPDGNLWFSEQGGFAFGSTGQIGQITPAGAITEFPLTPGISGIVFGTSRLSPLTVGPDKNLYFTFQTNGVPNPDSTHGFGDFNIGQITPSGNVTEFAGTGSGSSAVAYAPTVDSDGNLWFLEGPKAARLSPAQATADQAIDPDFTFFPQTTRSKKGITAIVVSFDEAMNAASAGNAALYSVASGVKKGHKFVYTKPVKIHSVTYNAAAGTATLALAKPIKTSTLQVTVRSGVVAANGTSTSSDYTSVVS
jgi:virginiamycin B lyase